MRWWGVCTWVWKRVRLPWSLKLQAVMSFNVGAESRSSARMADTLTGWVVSSDLKMTAPSRLQQHQALYRSRPCLCVSPRTLGRSLFHPQDSWAGRRFLWLHSNHLPMPHTDHRLDCPASPLSPGLRGDPTHKKKKKNTPPTRFSEIKAFPTQVPIWKNLSKDKWAWKSSFPSQRVDFSDKVVNCLSVINVKLAAVGPKICNYNNS